MSLANKIGRSKAKAALAQANVANATLPPDAEQRISDLEDVAHWHTNKTALDKVRGFSSFNFFGDGFGVSLATKTANYTLTTQDHTILSDATAGNITLTLPNPTLCYDTVNLASIKYSIAKIDSSAFTVTIAPYATETIGGDSSFVLGYQNEVLSLVTDGTNWYIGD